MLDEQYGGCVRLMVQVEVPGERQQVAHRPGLQRFRWVAEGAVARGIGTPFQGTGDGVQQELRGVA